MSRRIYQPQKEDDPYDLEGGPPRWRWHEPTGYFFPRAWATVARLETLTGTDYRVLAGLLSFCDWDNRCACSYGELGQAIGLARQNVSTSMQRLVAARLVYCEREGRGKKYAVTLSPELCWKGRPWHLARARESFRAQWRLHHSSRLAQPAGDEEPSPRGDGTSAAGKAPSFPHHTNGAVSSP